LRRWPGTKGFYPFTEPPVLRVAATYFLGLIKNFSIFNLE
jgi:hypothetical protein